MSALGSLVVKLGLEYAQYTQGLDKSGQEALKFGKNVQGSFDQAGRSAKEFMSGIVTGAVAGIASIVGINAAISKTRDSINILASINDAAEKTGSSIEDLSRIEQVSRNFGDSFVEIDKAIGKISKGLAEFKDPSNQAIRALDAIGVATHDSNGELRKAADVYIDVAKSLQQYEDGAQKTAVANALFGKSGTDLIPAMNNLASGIDSVRSVSAETTLAADDFKDAMARTGAIVDSLFFTMAGNLLPTLNNIIAAVNSSATQMDGFAASGNVVSTVLKGMVIAGYTIVDVFQGVGREIGGRAAQLVALSKLDFKAAGFIGDEIAKDSANARAEFDKFIDTVLNGDQKLADAATSGGMKKTIDFAIKSSEEIARMKTATDSSADASKNFMEKLEAEAAQLGKTSVEIRKMEAAKLGLSSVADPLIDRIEKETAAARKLEAQLSRVKSITESVQTADERFTQTVDELNDLMAMPDSGLSVETYSRAIKKAQSEVDQSMNATKDAGRQAANEWNDIWRNAENTARNSFVQFAAHGKNAMQSIGESIKLFIFDALYQLTVRKWIINVGASLGLGGVSGIASAAGVGGTGSSLGIGNIISAGSNLLSGFGSGIGSMLGQGASALGFTSFGAGATGAASAGVFGAGGSAYLGGAGTALGGTAATEFGAAATAGAGLSAGLSAVAGPAVIAFAATQILKSLAGNKRLGGGFGDVMNKIGNIPIIGDLLPIIPLINGLFGRGPLKQKETQLTGDIGSGGLLESGFLKTNFKAKGGLFASDKHDFAGVDLLTGLSSNDNGKALGGVADGMITYAKQVAAQINQTVGTVNTSLRSVAGALDLSVDPLDNFHHSINLISESGKALTDEQISGEISAITEEMARSLLPTVDQFSKLGENAVDTISRLGSEFLTLEQGARNLGASVDYAKQLISGMSFESRTAFVDLAGGVDNLNVLTSSFSKNFLNDAERLAPIRDQLKKGLTDLGFAADLTNEQYKALVQTINLSDEARIKLLELGDALFVVNSAADAAANTIKENANVALNSAFAALQRSVDAERKSITEKYNASLEAVNKRIQSVTDSIGKLKNLSDALKATISTLRPLSRDDAKFQILSAINQAKQGVFPEAKDIQEALGVLSQKSTAGFSSGFEFAREQAKTANLVGELGDLTDSQLSVEERSLKQLQDQQRTLQDGFQNEMDRLDELLAQAQNQINSINKLDTSIVALTEAIANFNLASSQGGGGVIGDGSISGNPNYSNQQIIDFFSVPRSPMEIYKAHLETGVSSQQIINTGRYTQADADKFFRDNPDIPPFANGGFHRGGLRIVGERGPELERTGPSHITSNKDLKKSIGNDRVVRELEKMNKILEAVTQGGTAVRTKTGT